jgi:hypothetical protein
LDWGLKCFWFSEKLTDKEFDRIRNNQGDVEESGSSQYSASASALVFDDDDEEDEAKQKEKDKASEEAFFRVKCKDNGMGMKHDDIPNMLGIGIDLCLV